MEWIGNMIEFIATTKFVMPSLTIIFFLFILLHVLFRLKEKELMSKVYEHLRILMYLFSIYILFALIIIGAIKDYVLYPFDFIIYTQLCGAIILWCLFIFNTVLRFSGLKTILIGIPIGFFGALSSCLLCYHLPNSIFYGTKFGIGHAPAEFLVIDLFLLMAYSLFIGGRNLYERMRGVK